MIVLAWRNIWRNRRRSMITISSIGFGVLFATFMMSVQYGTMDHMMDNAVKFYSGHIQIHQKGYWDERIIDNSLSYDQELLQRLDAIEQVVAVVPRIESFALVANDTKTRPGMVFGIDPQKENAITGIEKNLIKGAYLTQEDRAVLIASGLADYLNVSLGDSLVLISQGYHGINAVGLYPVKGIVNFPNPEQNKRMVCLPVKEAEWLYGLDDQLTSIALLLKDGADLEQSMVDVHEEIDSASLQPIDWKGMLPDLIQMVSMKQSSSQKMIMVLYIVIAFGMFGTFLMMTEERKYEFGILLSIGMGRLKLQVTMFYEILIMAMMGVFMGSFVSLSLISYIHMHPIQLSTNMQEMYESYGIEAVIEISKDPGIFYAQAWAIFIIALLLSIYPMFVLSRLKPVQAMREG